MENKRIIWFDIIRGFCLLLALWQHFGFYLNHWYVSFFNEKYLTGFYSVHKDWIGKNLSGDLLSGVVAADIFTPVVSQIFITLASFNLARYIQEQFSLKNKIITFGSIFFIFAIENFIVATNFGDALSLYPIMSWMVILSIVSIVFKNFGAIGIGFVFILSLLRFTMPVDLGIENWLQNNIHENIELDASIEYFISSSCLGFLLGKYYFNKPKTKELFGMVFLGITVGLFGLYNSPDFVPNNSDIFQNEHIKSLTFTGTLEFLGFQLAILSFALILHLKNIQVNNFFNFLIWIGKNSISLFLFHRIFFVYIYMPIATYLFTLNNSPIVLEWWVMWSAIVVYIPFWFFIQKYKILEQMIGERK